MVAPSEGRSPPRRRARLVALLGLGISAALFAALFVGFAAPKSSEGLPLVGEAAPDFRLPTTDGGNVSLTELRGEVVVLNFWASWCAPCREEAPLLEEVAGEFAPDGLRVLGVLYQDDPGAAREFERTYGLSYPTVVDAAGRVAIDYGIFGIPASFLIDRAGVIRERKLGPYSGAELRDLVRRYLS